MSSLKGGAKIYKSFAALSLMKTYWTVFRTVVIVFATTFMSLNVASLKIRQNVASHNVYATKRNCY